MVKDDSKVECRVETLERENASLKRDIDFLNNLNIPGAAVGLAKAVKRSLKYRATTIIVGRKHSYQSSDAIRELLQSAEVNEAVAKKMVELIKEDDALNVELLLKPQPKTRQYIYETVRRLSHIPKRVVKKIRGLK